jgi:hypothetical protein
MPVIQATAGSIKWEYHSPSQHGQQARHYLQNNLRKKRVGGMDQVIEHLPNKQEYLSSYPSVPPKKVQFSYLLHIRSCNFLKNYMVQRQQC